MPAAETGSRRNPAAAEVEAHRKTAEVKVRRTVAEREERLRKMAAVERYSLVEGAVRRKLAVAFDCTPTAEAAADRSRAADSCWPVEELRIALQEYASAAQSRQDERIDSPWGGAPYACCGGCC